MQINLSNFFFTQVKTNCYMGKGWKILPYAIIHFYGFLIWVKLAVSLDSCGLDTEDFKNISKGNWPILWDLSLGNYILK